MITLAAALPPHPGWLQNLQYQITGFLVVVFALGALAFLVWIAGKIFATSGAKQRATASPERPAVAGIPGPVMAAISAAVSVALEGRHYVVYDVAPSGRGAWSAEGRRAIYRSRQLR